MILNHLLSSGNSPISILLSFNFLFLKTYLFNSLHSLEFISGYDMSCCLKFFKTLINTVFKTFSILLHTFRFFSPHLRTYWIWYVYWTFINLVMKGSSRTENECQMYFTYKYFCLVVGVFLFYLFIVGRGRVALAFTNEDLGRGISTKPKNS